MIGIIRFCCCLLGETLEKNKRKNYGKIHKMDYMLFDKIRKPCSLVVSLRLFNKIQNPCANVTKAIFRPNSNNIYNTNEPYLVPYCQI